MKVKKILFINICLYFIMYSLWLLYNADTLYDGILLMRGEKLWYNTSDMPSAITKIIFFWVIYLVLLVFSIYLFHQPYVTSLELKLICALTIVFEGVFNFLPALQTLYYKIKRAKDLSLLVLPDIVIESAISMFIAIVIVILYMSVYRKIKKEDAMYKNSLNG